MSMVLSGINPLAREPERSDMVCARPPTATLTSAISMTRTDDDEVFAFPNGLSLPPVHPGRTIAAEVEAV